MRLVIKQRVFTWTDTFNIYDEYGNEKYFVKTEMFNIGHHMHIYDVYNGNYVVAHISKLIRWGDTYVIDIMNPVDEITGLMLVLAIDAANCDKN